MIAIGGIQRYRQNWGVEYPGIKAISISDYGNACAVSTQDHKILWFDGDAGYRWEVPLGDQINDLKMTGFGTHVVVATNRGFLFIDQTGKIVWNQPTPKPALAVTVNYFGTQITGTTDDRRILTFNGSGKQLEMQKVIDKLLKLTTSGSDEFQLAQAKSDVYLLDSTGHPLWNYKTIFGANEVAFSHKGNFFVAGGLDTIFCMTNDKQILWKTTAISKVTAISIPASDDGVVVGFSNGIVQYIDLKGAHKWEFQYGKSILKAKASGNGKFILVSTSDNNIVFTNDQGQMLWMHDTAGPQNIVEVSRLGVKLYCASTNNISCFENFLGVPDQYKETSRALKHLETLGAQVDGAKASLQQAKTAISQQQMELGSNISRQIFNAACGQRHNLIVKKMADVQKTIKAKAGQGVDVSEALAHYKRMQKGLAVREYDPVIEGINTIATRLAESEAKQEAKAFEDRFHNLNQMIKDAESEGLDVQVLQHRFQQIRTLYGNGEREEAQRTLKDLESQANETLKSHHQKKVKEGLEKLEGASKGLLDGSMKDQLESSIAQARYKVQQGNLLEARNIIQDGLKFAEEAQKNRKVYEAISSAEENLAKAKDFGMDVEKHGAILVEVKKLVEEGNFTHAYSTIRSVSIELEKMVRDQEIFQRNMEGFQSTFGALQEKVREAMSKGEDVAQMDMNLEQARSFAEKGAFPKATERMDKVSRMLERIGVVQEPTTDGSVELMRDEPSGVVSTTVRDTESIEEPPVLTPLEPIDEPDPSPPSHIDKEIESLYSDSGSGKGPSQAAPSANRCPNCSAEIPPGFAFCGKCGTKIGG